MEDYFRGAGFLKHQDLIELSIIPNFKGDVGMVHINPHLTNFYIH